MDHILVNHDELEEVTVEVVRHNVLLTLLLLNEYPTFLILTIITLKLKLTIT